jgi:catechol 2,3-dioxygenase-like lactoylglutathione lyase family enzyme
MFEPKAAFSGFAVKSLDEARKFYSETLGLKVDHDDMGLHLHLPGGNARVFVYDKPDHEPAGFTILNFVVEDIDAAVKELTKRGVTFERYDGLPEDEMGIVRGIAAKRGPDIAWFKDPSGNVLGVLQEA